MKFYVSQIGNTYQVNAEMPHGLLKLHEAKGETGSAECVAFANGAVAALHLVATMFRADNVSVCIDPNIDY